MEATFPLLFAAIVGFGHAFEADHLVAVSSIVTRRDKVLLAVKDGIYWGLGHTSTILIIGVVIILLKAQFLNGYFNYFEGFVGLMLILLGIFRLYQYFIANDRTVVSHDRKHSHHLAYGVGLVHGLAGSGTMVLLVMTKIQGAATSMIYLLIFGLGSVVGMLLAAGIFSLPFSKKLIDNKKLQIFLILVSSLLCIGYGIHVMTENLM